MNFYFSEISSLLDHSFGGVVSDFRGVETHLGEPRRGIHIRGVRELRTHFEEVGAHMEKGALMSEEWELKWESGNLFQE